MPYEQPVAAASSEILVADIIDTGRVSRQQLLVVRLYMFFNILDGFDITAMPELQNSEITR